MGNYRREHLLVLRQSLAAYRYFQRLLLECDREIHTTVKAINLRRREAEPATASLMFERTEFEEKRKSTRRSKLKAYKP